MTSKHPLAALIESVQLAQGWSDRKLEAIAAEKNLGLAKSTFSSLKNKPVKSLKGETVKALAAVLQLPEILVGMAGLASMGIQGKDSEETSVEFAIANDNQLDERSKQKMLALLRELRTDLQREQELADSNMRELFKYIFPPTKDSEPKIQLKVMVDEEKFRRWFGENGDDIPSLHAFHESWEVVHRENAASSSGAVPEQKIPSLDEVKAAAEQYGLAAATPEDNDDTYTDGGA